MTHLLVDANGLVCRLWYANPHEVPDRFRFATSDAATKHGARITVVAWDSYPTWRSELWAGYKAGRRLRPKPHALQIALVRCRRLVALPHQEVPLYEADDILAAVTQEFTYDVADQVLILSDDKDMAQLVGPQVRLLRSDGSVMGPAEVEAKWGVPPDRMRHLISWTGDSVDGLPGVRGVGPKKAIPRALAGEVGDPLTYQLTELAKTLNGEET